MKYILILAAPFYTKEESKIEAGFICEFEAETPIKKGDTIQVPTKGTRLETYKDLRPRIILEVTRNPRHIIEKGEVVIERGEVKRIELFTQKAD